MKKKAAFIYDVPTKTVMSIIKGLIECLHSDYYAGVMRAICVQNVAQ